MGTPAFAVSSLDILHRSGFEIAGVVTAPDKPAGRGLKMHVSSVKQYAVQHGLPVLQPVKLKDPVFLESLRALRADIQVVVAFRMLPEVVWDMPPLGTINLHASLLPAYRGAAPINWAIINGEKETGVTTFRLQHEIDTGAVIFQEPVPIREEETAGELHDRLQEIGAALVLKTLQAVAGGHYPLQPQQQMQTTQIHQAAPKIFKEDCRIRWDQPASDIYNFIRGLSPHPTAWTLLNGKLLKIFRARKKPDEGKLPAPGTITTDQRHFLRIAAQEGWIELLEVQLEGKKSMGIEAFLRGIREAPEKAG